MWRRNLLRTCGQWRQQTVPLAQIDCRENYKVALTVCQEVTGRCAWSSQGGHAVYVKQVRLLRNSPGIVRSLKVAADGLRRAAGPHAQGHPNYLTYRYE